MPVLYYSPETRATRIIGQLIAMDKLDAVEVKIVDIIKGDGSGRIDPDNAHPEGKVPYLITDEGEHIRESAAIMMYLDELFGQPQSPAIGAPDRGAYLSWMAYSGGVLDPVLVAAFSGLEHPALAGAYRGMSEVCTALETALSKGDFLLGASLSVADILLASPFQWAPHLMPDSAIIKSWVDRVGHRLDGEAIAAFEVQALSTLNALEDA